MEEKVKIIECPRDAMQGMQHMVPSATKSDYLNQLMNVGFHTLDFGSFVSPKVVPQMRDTAEVLVNLKSEKSSTHLLAIVANTRGADIALEFGKVRFLGFPLSISATFQKRNTNKSIEEAIMEVNDIHLRCKEQGKELVVYLSMGFGNPYGEAYDPEMVTTIVAKLVKSGISIFALSDTVGQADSALIHKVVTEQVAQFPKIEFGLHLHSRKGEEKDKITAALEAGCRRFDGAILGFGGCPMAKDDLVGNISTEKLVKIVEAEGFTTGINHQHMDAAVSMAKQVFHT